jgi:hypothetical protein
VVHEVSVPPNRRVAADALAKGPPAFGQRMFTDTTAVINADE